jgi:hypothetical protein
LLFQLIATFPRVQTWSSMPKSSPKKI